MEYIEESNIICNFLIDGIEYVIFEDSLENIQYGKILIYNDGRKEIVDITEEELLKVQSVYDDKFKNILDLEGLGNE